MTESPRQLPLALGYRPSLASEDYLVAESNGDAVRWIELWPAWQMRALVLWGPDGCGKTHLAHVFLDRSRGVLVDHDVLRADIAVDVASRAGACIVDDADLAVAAGLERPMLHLYNLLTERGGHLLLTAATPPARWAIGLADLRSRLNTAASVGIGTPDDRLIAGLIAKLFADRRLVVDDEVILYAVSRIERSFAAARRLVADLDAAALGSRRKISVALLRQVLQRSREGDRDADA